MKTEQELKEIYVNSHHKAVEKFFNELFTLSGDSLDNRDISDKAEQLQAKLREEIAKTQLTDEEREFIKHHVREWTGDRELNHDLMRHILKKLLENKDKIEKKSF